MDKEKLKRMLDSEMGMKIMNHTERCAYCQHLQSALGFLIEKHMEEKEDLDKLA